MDRLIIDVREDYEYAAGHVKGAINILRAQGFTNLVNGINQNHVNARYL
ncbi:MAG TPA: rhodanese-like domain-containing protein [Candidatus Saccharimonadales bacterium]